MWNTEKIDNLSGKIIIVTGANSGIGFYTAKVLANKGAKIIFASRNKEKSIKAIDQILRENKNADITYIKLDLADLENIKKFGNEFKNRFKKLDVLCNNAGIMWTPYQKTVDGFEMQFGTNHLGHFALTGILMDCLKNTRNSRVITVSSIAHFSSSSNLMNQYNESNYNRYKAYSKSKLANLLFAYELQRKFDQNKIESLSIAVHPGVARTNLFKSGTKNEKNSFRSFYHNSISFLLGQTAYLGAIPLIRAATDIKIKGGKYYGPLILGLWGWAVINFSSPVSHNKKLAEQLWKYSEEATGIKYNFYK